MSQKLNLKGIAKTREELIQEHSKQVGLESVPAAFTHFNPLKFSHVTIAELDLFTPPSLSVLYARTITHPNTTSTTSSIIEDNQGNVCKLFFPSPTTLPLNSMLALLEPLLILKNDTSTIEIKDLNNISLFTDEQEFCNAGWGQKMPPGFSCDHYKSQGQQLEEKKQYKEALRKYSIALNHDPQNVEVMTGLIACYAALGDTDNALSVSKRALELSPGHLKLVKLRTKCLVDCGRIQEARVLVENSRVNDIDLDSIVEDKGNKKIVKCNRTRLCRLKELVLVEWPKLVSIEKIKKKLNDEGVNADRVSIRGKTAILIYDSVEKREEARVKLLELEDSEFMLANEPALYE